MSKFIREMRVGRPKTVKTGAVVGTYPKPMLYLGFDRGGIDIIPPKTYVPAPTDATLIKMDCCYEDITFFKPGSIDKALALPTQSPITAVDYTTNFNLDLSLDYAPTKSQEAAINFVGDYNKMTTHIRTPGKVFPWKTVVADSMTGFGDMWKNHLSSFNPNAMATALQWAFMVGEKQRALCLSLTGFPCHIVVIFHTQEPEKNDETMQINEVPNAYAKSFRDVVPGMFSQYFYATKIANKPVIKNADYLFVKGCGSRWPAGLPNECPADFKSIYGKEAEL